MPSGLKRACFPYASSQMGECAEGRMVAAVCEDCAMHEPLFHGLSVNSQIKTDVHVKQQLDVDNDDRYSMQPQGSQRLNS